MSVYESLTPAQRSLRARTASFASWANTPDPKARGRRGYATRFRRYEDQVDPERVLPEEERYRMAKAAEKAHMASISLKRLRSKTS